MKDEDPIRLPDRALDEKSRLLLDATIEELLQLARHAGYTISDLNALLDSGLTLGDLVDVLAAKLFKRAA